MADEYAYSMTQDQKNGLIRNSVLNQYNTNPLAGYYTYGTNEELNNAAANLSQVGAMTGQNISDIGQRATAYDKMLTARENNSDPVAQYMMDQRNRNKANTARAIGGKGVAGGVAASGMNQAQMQADSAINAQLDNRQSETMAMRAKQIAQNQKATGAALSQGKQQGTAADMNVDVGSGITLICTELKRQGLLPKEVWEADHAFGVYAMREYPRCMAGYHLLARPIVGKMKQSKKFTKIVSWFAIPWARSIAGDTNIVGLIVMGLGFPLCSVVGTFISGEEVVNG